MVATYRRPESLLKCLDGVRTQTTPPAEIIVVHHESDVESARALTELDWPELRIVIVAKRGTVAAFNLGLSEARRPIVAFVDDDTVPREEWLARTVATFTSDERIAAVGGRDVVHEGPITLGRNDLSLLSRRHSGRPLRVGRVSWWGYHVGNHHVATGPPRDVDVLKGANMSFRRRDVCEAGFDERLRGEGAQPHSELSICLPLRRQGRRVVYDPQIIVDHFPAPRLHGSDRDDEGLPAAYEAAHNEALSIIEHLSWPGRWVYASWGVLAGTREAPGILNTVRLMLGRSPRPVGRLIAAQRGRRQAWRSRRRTGLMAGDAAERSAA